jgi:hypothetical protein
MALSLSKTITAQTQTRAQPVHQPFRSFVGGPGLGEEVRRSGRQGVYPSGPELHLLDRPGEIHTLQTGAYELTQVVSITGRHDEPHPEAGRRPRRVQQNG